MEADSDVYYLDENLSVRLQIEEVPGRDNEDNNATLPYGNNDNNDSNEAIQHPTEVHDKPQEQCLLPQDSQVPQLQPHDLWTRKETLHLISLMREFISTEDNQPATFAELQTRI